MLCETTENVGITDRYALHQYVMAKFGTDDENSPLWSNSGGLLTIRTHGGNGLPMMPVTAGEFYRFRLRAKAMKKAVINGKKRRVPVKGDWELTEWLNSRALPRGFELHQITSLTVAVTEINKPESPHTFPEVTYYGRLRVLDVDLFTQTLADAIGHGRAFGCGMLMIKGDD